ncbi:MAG TPA: hypothetical protein PLD46_10175 [Hyphomicrobium sp.]|nr:hypothetical protein [Hyphomicrobium sp.]
MAPPLLLVEIALPTSRANWGSLIVSYHLYSEHKAFRNPDKPIHLCTDEEVQFRTISMCDLRIEHRVLTHTSPVRHPRAPAAQISICSATTRYEFNQAHTPGRDGALPHSVDFDA